MERAARLRANGSRLSTGFYLRTFPTPLYWEPGGETVSGPRQATDGAVHAPSGPASLSPVPLQAFSPNRPFRANGAALGPVPTPEPLPVEHGSPYPIAGTKVK